MAIKDTVTAKYMRQNEIFADAFNFFIYGGNQIIRPDSLEELDTRQIAVPYGGDAGAGQPVQRTRDVIKSVTAMTDRRTAYLLLAVENQSHIHYAMPVKNMVYDALQYAGQVEKAVASHKLSGDYKESSGDEYLSGFMKSDRLMPVVTLTLYFDSKRWDGPVSVHEMFETQDPAVLSLVPNYRLNLIAPASIQDSDFKKFKTTLKEVLSFIKYSYNKEKLKELLESDEGFQQLGRNEIDVLNACANAKLSAGEKKGAVNVLTAIEEMIQEAADKAAREAAGKAAKDVKEAENQTRTTTLLSVIQAHIEKMGWTAEQSMDLLNIAESDRQQLLKLLN